ncbi:MAG: leucine-rich repeat protein [Candidatus Thorarchaeota archaeon]
MGHIGPKGDKGQVGFQGSKGQRGPTGFKGDPGDVGPTVAAAKGDKGDNGSILDVCESKTWVWQLGNADPVPLCGPSYIGPPTPLPSDVTDIPANSAFPSPNGCPDTQTIVIPKCVEKIGNSAFKNSSNIKTITFESASKPPPSADTLVIDPFAFYLDPPSTPGASQGVTDLVIPGNCSLIRESAFANHTNLKSLQIQKPSSSKGVQNESGGMTQPSSLGIENNAFYGCTQLGSSTQQDPDGVTLIIPYGVVFVGAGAFRETGLQKVFIPNNCVYEPGGGGQLPAFPDNCEIVTYSI